MYIQYTSIDLASLLIYQVSRVMLLQWLFPLLQKHLVSGLGSTLGFFIGAAADLPFHEVSLLSLALLETSGLVDHQHLMLFLDFNFCRLEHRVQLGNGLLHPLHIVVKHKAFVAWWERLEDSVNYSIIRKFDSK